MKTGTAKLMTVAYIKFVGRGKRAVKTLLNAHARVPPCGEKATGQRSLNGFDQARR